MNWKLNKGRIKMGETKEELVENEPELISENHKNIRNEL